MYEPTPTPAYQPPPPPRSTGPSGAALLLIGVIVGGVAGGATATLLDGRTPAELVPTPTPATIATSEPVTVTAGADPIVDVASEMLPSVVTVVNRTFFFQAEDGIRDKLVTGVQTCALPI